VSLLLLTLTAAKLREGREQGILRGVFRATTEVVGVVCTLSPPWRCATYGAYLHFSVLIDLDQSQQVSEYPAIHNHVHGQLNKVLYKTTVIMLTWQTYWCLVLSNPSNALQ